MRKIIIGLIVLVMISLVNSNSLYHVEDRTYSLDDYCGNDGFYYQCHSCKGIGTSQNNIQFYVETHGICKDNERIWRRYMTHAGVD